MRTRFRQVLSICLIILAIGSIMTPVASASEYDLEVVDSVSTPEETIEIEGTEYSVDGIGVIEPGEAIEMDVTSSEQYRIYLYNTDKKTEYDKVWSASEDRVAMGTENDALDTTSLEPGTYLLSLEVRGAGRQAVYPIVIEGYDLSVEYPETASADEEVEFTAAVSSTESTASVDTVDVAVWDGANEERMDLELESQGDGTYRTTVAADKFGEGEYSVYGAIFGDGEVQSYPPAMAIDSGPTFTVAAEETADDDTTAGGGSDGVPSDGDSEDEDDSSDDDTPENDSDPSGGDTPSNGTDASDGNPEDEGGSSDDDVPTNETDPADEGNTSSGSGASEEANSDGNSENITDEITEPNDSEDTDGEQPIEPNSESDDGSPETDPDDDSLPMPGFGSLVAVLALLSVSYRFAH